MGYLVHIAVAVGLVALAESLPSRGNLPAWGAAVLLLVPHALAWTARRAALRGRFQAAGRWAVLFELSPLVGHAAAHLLFGLGALLVTWPAVIDWPGLGLLTGLVPYVLLQALAIDARGRLLESGARRGWTAFQVRMLAAALLPIALLVLLLGLVSESRFLRVQLEEVSLMALASGVVLLVLFALGLPALLRVAWRLEALPHGPHRAALEPLAQRLGLHPRRIHLWNTAGTVANAAILGFTARSRRVLFSDQLLEELSPREARAVLAHEAGHAVRRHALHFAALTLGFFLLGDFLWNQFGTTGGSAQGLTLCAGIGLWYFGFGFLSRRFELEADLFALRATQDPEALCAALERLVGLHARARTGWRHFSVAQRVLFLRAAARCSDVGARLERVLRRWRVGAWTLLLLGVGGQLWLGYERLPIERVHVALRLGDYARALEGAKAEGAPEGLLRLARAGVETAPDGDPAQLLGAARTALEEGDMERVRLFVELALWQDVPGMQRAAALLDGQDPSDPIGESSSRRALSAALADVFAQLESAPRRRLGHR